MTELAGHTVLLTRAEEDNEAWAERLTAVDALPIALPCIRTEAITDRATADALAAALETADWLVFTSRRGVEAFARLAQQPVPESARVAVVGTATAAEAEARLGRADLSSEAGTARSLAEALAEHLAPGSQVLLAVAENAAATLEELLGATGASCTRVDVYRTVPVPAIARKRALSALGADNVLLASPSAVTGFVNQVAMDIDADIYTIGPSTTAAAQAAGLNVTGQAEYPSLEGLMEAMTCAS
jgi:uroporphyrinogen-III synthase